MSRQPGQHHLLGSVYDRRRRVEWMIETFGIPRKCDGRKTRVPCAWCGSRMWATAPNGRRWEIDRFPVCGHNGGRYVRGNIIIACKTCNATRCTKVKKCRRSAPPKFIAVKVAA
jgi:hypothetical protein